MSDQDSSPRPKWMDDTFLKICIRNSNNLPSDYDITILDASLKYAVPKGENYMSLMYKTMVEYRMADGKVKKESIICKVTHDDLALAKMTFPLFSTETEMYTKVIPEMHKLMEKKNLKTTFACRCLHTITEGCPRVLALDDLVVQGYGVANRRKGLDLTHVKLVMSKLAKFHAASRIAFESMSSDLKQSISTHPFFKDVEGDMANREEIKTFSEGSSKSALAIALELAKHGNKYTKTTNFLRRYADFAEEAMMSMAPLVPGSKFNALCHADFWVNNMMFKFSEDGSVKDVIFIDLQISHYASVAQDFLYFFISSCDMQVRRFHFDEVKKFYLDSFISNLRQLGYKGDVPTEDEFNEEMKRCVLIATFAMTTILPMILTEFDSKTQAREDSNSFSIKEMTGLLDKSTDAAFFDVIRATVDVLQDRGIFDKFPELVKKERAMGV